MTGRVITPFVEIPPTIRETTWAKVNTLLAREEAGKAPMADTQWVDSELAWRLLITVEARDARILELEADLAREKGGTP